MKTPILVSTIEQALASIRKFNHDLAQADDAARGLVERLAYNRAWYFDPETGQVGPSKFVGYVGMTAAAYVGGSSLDGKQTEPVLQRWFRSLDPGSPEESHVRAKVEALLVAHHKQLNRAVRFCAQIGWALPESTQDRMELLRSQHVARLTTKGPDARRRILHATVAIVGRQTEARCDEMNLVARGPTTDEALTRLQKELAERIDSENLQSLGFVQHPVVQVTLELSPWGV